MFEEVGKIGRDQAVRALREENKAGEHWAEVAFDDLAVSPLAENVVLLTYAATARWNHEQAPSKTLCSTVYVRNDGQWRVALHQQTAA